MPRAVLTLLFLAVSLRAASSDAQQGGTIAGVVRNAWSKQGLKRATVTLTTGGAEPMQAVVYSDLNGAFAFTGVPPGDYFLCALFRGYQRGCIGSEGRDEPAQALTVTAATRRENVAINMLPLGDISGTVLDSDGDPVPNAQIRMLRPIYERRSLHWQAQERATTNDKGEYRLSFVRPGKYVLAASHPWQGATIIRPEATNGQAQPKFVYAERFYPSADSVSSAEMLTLSAGNELKDLNFTLTPTREATIHGRVEGAGEIGGFVQVQLLPAKPTDPGEQLGGGGAGPPEYQFQMQPAEPGQYRLVASAKSSDGDVFRAVQPVDAQPGENDFDVTLIKGAPLRGHLKMLGDAPKTDEPYQVHLYPGDGLPLAEQFPETEVQPDGSFEFKSVPPGIWDIGVTPEPPGSYIQSMLLGKEDVLTADMILTDAERPPLDIVLDMNGATVTGHITKDGNPIRAMVLLSPNQDFEHVLSFYQVRSTDGRGKFEMKGVTPGHYKVYAFDKLQQGEFWDPDFITPFRDQGVAIDVKEGSTVEQDAKVIVRDEVVK